MANPGEAKVFLAENATNEIYTHVEKEISDVTPDDALTEFTVTTAPVSITGLDSGALALPQYVDADGDYFRKDVLVYFRKDGKDTVVNTTTNAVTIATDTLTFATAVTIAEADKVVVS